MGGEIMGDNAPDQEVGSAARRGDGRARERPRPCEIITGFTTFAEGSVLVSTGATKVICNASLTEGVPSFRRGSGAGWVTAEYSMLPRATNTRSPRELTLGKAGGRTLEIQRLIGRSLRAVVEPQAMGENTIFLDCDVIQADGGTRTAAITGGFVALVLALRALGRTHAFPMPPIRAHLAAVSVGVLGAQALLDMDYQEDSAAQVDLNVVMTESKDMVEIQGSAEQEPFSRALLEEMMNLAEIGITQRIAAQREALGGKLV